MHVCIRQNSSNLTLKVCALLCVNYTSIKKFRKGYEENSCKSISKRWHHGEKRAKDTHTHTHTHTHTQRHLTEAETLTDINRIKRSRERQFTVRCYFYPLNWQILGNPPHHLLERMQFNGRSVITTATLRKELGIFLQLRVKFSPSTRIRRGSCKRNTGTQLSGAVHKEQIHES